MSDTSPHIILPHGKSSKPIRGTLNSGRQELFRQWGNQQRLYERWWAASDEERAIEFKPPKYASSKLGFSKDSKSIYRLIDEGSIPCIKIKGRWYVHMASLFEDFKREEGLVPRYRAGANRESRRAAPGGRG